MSSLNGRIAREVLDAHVRLVYSVVRKAVKRECDRQGRTVPPEEMEELVQDAAARACGSFLNRCEKRLPKVEDRKAWICQCAFFAAKRACRAKTTFGNPDPKTGYVDALNRRGGLPRGFRHGSDDECRDALEQVHYQPVQYGVQRWEVEKVLEDNRVPDHLRMSAVYAAMGINQEDSGKLQGFSERTVRNRLKELREYLDPDGPWSFYGIAVATLKSLLNRE